MALIVNNYPLSRDVRDATMTRPAFKPGPRNLITDVEGLLVGNAEDHQIMTGSTVLVGNESFVTGVHVMGGAPGTRETDLLGPDKSVEKVDAIVLSGGSSFGLDAAAGVSDALVAAGRGFRVDNLRIPVVPAAILFDLTNGGNKGWSQNPYRQLGVKAMETASDDFALGTTGAGTGAMTANLKGGLGSASIVLESGVTVGALVAVNSFGSVVAKDGTFYANPFEIDDEFGGHTGTYEKINFLYTLQGKEIDFESVGNTTIAIVATDAVMTKAAATRMAIAAHDGMARAIIPSHTPIDGDIVFAVSTGQKELGVCDAMTLGHVAANCLTRAIARAVFEATAHANDTLPTWKDKFDNAEVGG